MSDLLPCPFCGGAAEIVGEFELDAVACQTCYARTDAFAGVGDHAAAAWNRRAPADPALLALAKFGARIVNDYHRGKWGFISADGDWLDIDAASAGVKEYAGAPAPAPGIADAIARLLAPDGAGEVARECKCRLRTRLVGDGCDVCNPELAAEYARQREVTDGD